MSSPSPPKPKKVNPYAGVNSDVDVYRAQKALGIDKIKKDKHMVRINRYLLNERWEKEGQRGSFENSLQKAQGQGLITPGDRSDWALEQVLNFEEERRYEAQRKEQQQQLKDQYDQTRKDQKEDAEAQRELMEEMMNQPVYMAQQAPSPQVQAPSVDQEPLMPAPAVNTPMSIDAPPAPELTTTGNKLAIVRTPKSTQARKRKATRGTSSLTN